MFRKNAQRRLMAAGFLVERAKTLGITNAEKSSYYRSASILLATVVEGMTYELVKKHTSTPDHIIATRSENKVRHKIPSTTFGTPNDLVICECVKSHISIKDRGITFEQLNIFLKKERIITEVEYKALDWVRVERNKIHLQGMETSDTGYTKAKIERISGIVRWLDRRSGQ